MSWLIRVGKLAGPQCTAKPAAPVLALFEFATGFEPGMNAGVTTYSNCLVTSNSGHVSVQLIWFP